MPPPPFHPLPLSMLTIHRLSGGFVALLLPLGTAVFSLAASPPTSFTLPGSVPAPGPVNKMQSKIAIGKRDPCNVSLSSYARSGQSVPSGSAPTATGRTRGATKLLSWRTAHTMGQRRRRRGAQVQGGAVSPPRWQSCNPPCKTEFRLVLPPSSPARSTMKAQSYSAQYDELLASKARLGCDQALAAGPRRPPPSPAATGSFSHASRPLCRPQMPPDTRQRCPKPSMEEQSKEPGAQLIPLSQGVWVVKKVNDWVEREP